MCARSVAQAYPFTQCSAHTTLSGEVRLARSMMPLPDPQALGALVIPAHAGHRAITQLHTVLGELLKADSLDARELAFERLARWVTQTGKVPAVAGAPSDERAELTRLRLLLAVLQALPALRAGVAEALSQTLSATQGARFFARAGLPSDRGLWSETTERLFKSVLPEPRDETDLGQLVQRWVPSQRALDALALVPPEVARDAMLLFAGTETQPPGMGPLTPLVKEALRLLAVRVSAVGLSDVIAQRSARGPLEASPFYQLPRVIDAALAQSSSGTDADFAHALEDTRNYFSACREQVTFVVQHLEDTGVSVDVVYRLELIERNLARMDLLLRCLERGDDLVRARHRQTMIVTLLTARMHDRRIADILHNTTHLLSRKIIERAGHTGEHYITTTAGQYFKMLLSAAGGGVLTAGTAALKFLIGWLKFAPFVEGALSAINYAGSFLVMQMMGFTLATKQPSVTAAALAGTLRETSAHPELGKLVTTIACITRSQLAAAVGNVGMVIPASLCFDYYWRTTHDGAPFLDAETAAYVVHSLHPTETGTLWYATLTGILLWISSLCAGWLENWSAYRRLPEAISDHWLGRFVGRRTMAFFARVFSRNISGFGGNTSLGVLLAATPIAGKFFGLPLDVRHVTLSTGALTLALSALGTHPSAPEAVAAALGIAAIGALNFGVSFVLSLNVALRAREVERKDRMRLVAALLWTFIKSPFQFFFPPLNPAQVRVHGPHSVPPPATNA